MADGHERNSAPLLKSMILDTSHTGKLHMAPMLQKGEFFEFSSPQSLCLISRPWLTAVHMVSKVAYRDACCSQRREYWRLRVA